MQLVQAVRNASRPQKAWYHGSSYTLTGHCRRSGLTPNGFHAPPTLHLSLLIGPNGAHNKQSEALTKKAIARGEPSALSAVRPVAGTPRHSRLAMLVQMPRDLISASKLSSLIVESGFDIASMQYDCRGIA